MGPYEDVKIRCKISDFGLKILGILNKEKSWLKVSDLHPEYSFLEFAARIASKGRYKEGNQDLLSELDIVKLTETKELNYEFYNKIDSQKISLLKFVLPFLSEGKIYFYYWNEFYDSCDSPFPKKKADEWLLKSQKPQIYWSRKMYNIWRR